MKYLLVFLLCFIFSLSFSQSKTAGKVYSTIQVMGYRTEEYYAGGSHLSFGYHNNGLIIGPGIGLMTLPKTELYVPIYCNFAYVGGKRKVSPMGNIHFGKGINMDGRICGFYGMAVAGVSIKFKKSRIHVFGGGTLMNYRYENDDILYQQGPFTAGIGFFTTN